MAGEGTLYFKPGNRLWELRKNPGPHRSFEKPEDIWIAAVKYFEWVIANPLIEKKVFVSNGVKIKDDLPKMRAMTVEGLVVHLGISTKTWTNYRRTPELAEIVAHVDAIIYEYKFTGAAADLLNATIIARSLGLTEKIDNNHSGSVGLHEISDDELDRRIEQRQQQLTRQPPSQD